MVSSTPRPHFTPGKDPVPILQEALWAPGPVWTGGKSRPYRDSIPDRPARSQSLYRLSYPADICKVLSVFCYISHSFLVLNFLPNRCRCKGLLLHLIGLNDTHTQTHTNTHKHTLGRTPLDKGSARRRHLCLTTHRTHNIQSYPGRIPSRSPSKRADSDLRSLAVYEVVIIGSVTLR